MKARDIMTANPACCRPSDTARDAAKLMESRDCGCVPVVSDEGSRHLVGVVTDRDLALRGLAHDMGPDTPLEDLMSFDVSCCHPDDDVREIERIMMERQVRRVPVVDDERRVVGIVAQADLAVSEEAGTSAGEVGRVVERISEPEDAVRDRGAVLHGEGRSGR
ncbi:MAG TPA: CBS domain-containing protein [Longimicrobiales bacterium]|nr:CBS domain-containing protein [Longimicrobiales bacterium]